MFKSLSLVNESLINQCSFCSSLWHYGRLMYYNYKHHRTVLKLLDLIHRKILWTQQKQWIWLVYVYKQTKQRCFSNNTHIKLKKFKAKSVNSELKVHQVYRVTPCFVSHGFRTIDMHLRTNRLSQLLGIKIVFLSQLPTCWWYIFKNILIFIWISDENEICVKMTIANQGTKSPVTILSLVNDKHPVKNRLFTSNIHYHWKGIDFEVVIL